VNLFLNREDLDLLGLCSDCSVSLSAYFTIFMAKWPEDNVKLIKLMRELFRELLIESLHV